MITTGQGLKAAGLDRQDFKALPGSDARKVALAKFLREPTTVSLEWVARALCMGGAANAGHYVRTRPWKSVRRKIPKAMLRFIERKANCLREMVTIMHTDPGFGFMHTDPDFGFALYETPKSNTSNGPSNIA